MPIPFSSLSLGLISTKCLNITSIYINISRNKIFIKKNKYKVNSIKLISVNLPESYLKVLEILVSEGKFPNRSEAIRVSIRDLIKTEYIIEESVKRNIGHSLIEEKMVI